MTSAARPLYRKYSAIAQPAYGAIVLDRRRFIGGGHHDDRVVKRAGVLERLRQRHHVRFSSARSATYTHARSRSVLLMIVSIAIAVLPVWRSPMISSRWPRPIGIIESIALRPVSIGSVTGWRSTHARRLVLGRAGLARRDLPLAVERVTERVDDAAFQLVADRDVK